MVSSAARGASAPTEEGEGRGHSVAAPAQFVMIAFHILQYFPLSSTPPPHILSYPLHGIPQSCCSFHPIFNPFHRLCTNTYSAHMLYTHATGLCLYKMEHLFCASTKHKMWNILLKRLHDAQCYCTLRYFIFINIDFFV